LVGANDFLEKSFSMKNIFSKEIDFHITFFIVWYKINYFSRKKKKYQLSHLSGKKYQLSGHSRDKY